MSGVTGVTPARVGGRPWCFFRVGVDARRSSCGAPCVRVRVCVQWSSDPRSSVQSYYSHPPDHRVDHPLLKLAVRPHTLSQSSFRHTHTTRTSTSAITTDLHLIITPAPRLGRPLDNARRRRWSHIFHFVTHFVPSLTRPLAPSSAVAAPHIPARSLSAPHPPSRTLILASAEKPGSPA